MSNHQHSAKIEIILKDRRLSRVFYLALRPEVKDKAKGYNVEMLLENEKLIVKFNAKSLSRLRAILNSYMRWIKSIQEVITR
ncbi:MAG: KEOPS complex subunit Pcc1 [Candidatus Nezhaarchaeota archaeon]|nr:KEOPS complex subunit Pcc1 [Candidatus Nezhaarchaeota archaeon]MCX8141934.1 KEOPS complex subunit Pcc1 [Candidatus Nezhaarchaeota archaeon]MDW8050285.1 KEOPS complex subunit Pcc1 [Nitrososphaerota archaeon]